jgi:hypothetical protein
MQRCKLSLLGALMVLLDVGAAHAQAGPTPPPTASPTVTTPPSVAQGDAAVPSAPPAVPSAAPPASPITSSIPAAAEPPAGGPVEYSSSRRGIGWVAAAGLHTGLALGVRLGAGDIGIEVAGGYQLLVALWHERTIFADSDNIDAGSSAQVSGEVYLTPWHPVESSAIGIKGGYRYNTVLHNGFSIAITFLADLNPHLALEGLAGASIFPGSAGRLRRALDLPSDADLIYASNAQFFEYGFELIWYP